MSLSRAVRRETVVSVAINSALSAGFFVGMFGIDAPVSVSALGRDFLPQAFMVAFMGSLVPGLLTARRCATGAWRRITVRSLAVAAVALVTAGGVAFAVCLWFHAATIDPFAALGLKVAFGMLLALAFTPSAVVDAFRPATDPDPPIG